MWTWNSSGSTRPWTMFSPRPYEPVTRTTSRKPGFRVEREGDPAGGEIGAHHLHHADREADLEMVEAIVVAIDDGAIGEHRREAAAARLEELVRAADVQVALVLAGETRRRQILGGGRAADGHGNALAILLFEKPVGFDERCAQGLGPGRRVDDLARLRCVSRQSLHVGAAQILQQGSKPLPGAGLVQCIAIGLGRQGEAVRHLHTVSSERGVELAQRGVFSPDLRHILRAQLAEPPDVRSLFHRDAPLFRLLDAETHLGRHDVHVVLDTLHAANILRCGPVSVPHRVVVDIAP